MRRIDGRPIERFIADELAGPLGADFLLGCTEADGPRVVPGIPNPVNVLMNGGLVNARTLPLFHSAPAHPGFMATPGWLRAVNPSANGVSNALGIARLFSLSATGGEQKGRRLFSSGTSATACEQQWHDDDSLFGNDFRVALGLLLDCDFTHFGREGNVGSAGAGGYTVFADPASCVAFGLAPNRCTSGSSLGDESRLFVDALFRWVWQRPA